MGAPINLYSYGPGARATVVAKPSGPRVMAILLFQLLEQARCDGRFAGVWSCIVCFFFEVEEEEGGGGGGGKTINHPR